MKNVKVEIYIPEEFIKPTVSELTKLGACKIGNQCHTAFGILISLRQDN